jgi:hypothetical protein
MSAGEVTGRLDRLDAGVAGAHTVRFEVGPGERAAADIYLELPGDCAQIFASPEPIKR